MMNNNDNDIKRIKKKIRGNLAINIIVYIMFFLATLVAVVCFWANTTLNVRINEIMITLAGPLDGAGTDSLSDALLFCIPRISVVMSIITFFYVYVYIKAKKIAIALCGEENVSEASEASEASGHDDGEMMAETEERVYSFPKRLIIIRRIVAAASPVMLFLSIMYVNYSYGVAEYVSVRNAESTIYEDHYVSPDTVAITNNGKKKNLIHIYVESLETTYLSVEEGGFQEENLMPNLTRLARENVSFNNTDGSRLGGFYSDFGATWTFGALYTSLSGVPYNLPVEGNAVPIVGEYATGLITVGDILEKQGYHNEFLCGSDSNFAGRKQFLKTHGDYEIYDYYTAIEKKDIPPSYYAWWGFEDQKLYSIAKEELSRLAQEEEPFNFTMLTADTHFPDGYECELCEKKYDEYAANIVDCADRQIAEFIDWIMEQPFYEDSVIIITGDHPRMDTVLVEGAQWHERRMYNCIINGAVSVDKSRTVNREFATIDIFPTIIAALGFQIEGDRLGLGTNLYSSEPTLAEQMGLYELDQQLTMKSDFYLEEFAPELIGKDLSNMKKSIKHVKDKKALKKIKRGKKKLENRKNAENEQNQDNN